MVDGGTDTDEVAHSRIDCRGLIEGPDNIWCINIAWGRGAAIMINQGGGGCYFVENNDCKL